MITSPHNDKLSLLRRLDRRRARERERLFACEGEDLVTAAVDAGWQPAFCLVAADSGLTGLAPDAEEAEPALLEEVSRLGSGTRAIAAFRLPEIEPVDPDGPCAVYLDGVGDPGNVGAIVRTVHALSGWDLVLGPGSADPFGPRAVRASMGAIFATRVRRGDGSAGPVGPPARVGLVPPGDTPSLDDGLAAGTRTLCLGAEREGLRGAVAEHCDALVAIPQRPGAVESLNVAAAAAIALHRISSAAAVPAVAEENPRG